jgi:hypothetical protein
LNLIQLLKGFLQTAAKRRAFYKLTQLHIGTESAEEPI